MYNNFVVEGAKIATEIIKQPELEIGGIYACESWIMKNQSLLNKYDSVLHRVNAKELDRISSLKTPNQVLVVCKIPTNQPDWTIINNSLTLYLDNLQNPGNMGTIFRIADWFGLPYIFCSKTCVELYNPKVIQATMGAFLRVKLVAIDFEHLIEKTSNLPTYATVLNGENILKTKFSSKGIIIIGNEGTGISASIIEQASHQISIPKGKKGGAESLNVAVATGIICAAFS